MKRHQAIQKAKEVFPFPQMFPEWKWNIGSNETAFSTVQKYIEPSARVLDFGAGMCDKSAVLSLMGYEVHACDDLRDHWHLREGYRNKIIDFARQCNVHFVLLDQGIASPWQPDSFDMVMIHHVIEHLHDSPRQILNDLVALIKSGGYLFLTTPNAGNLKKRLKLLFGKTNMPDYGYFYWQQGSWRGHVREYVRDDLRRLAKYLNLEIVELRGSHDMIGKLAPTVRPVWRLGTAVIDGWRDSWVLVARKPTNWSAQRSLSADDPLHRTLQERFLGFE